MLTPPVPPDYTGYEIAAAAALGGALIAAIAAIAGASVNARQARSTLRMQQRHDLETRLLTVRQKAYVSFLQAVDLLMVLVRENQRGPKIAEGLNSVVHRTAPLALVAPAETARRAMTYRNALMDLCEQGPTDPLFDLALIGRYALLESIRADLGVEDLPELRKPPIAPDTTTGG